MSVGSVQCMILSADWYYLIGKTGSNPIADPVRPFRLQRVPQLAVAARELFARFPDQFAASARLKRLHAILQMARTMLWNSSQAPSGGGLLRGCSITDPSR